MEGSELPFSDRLRLIKLGLLPKETGPKPKKAIPKISEKKKKEMAEERQARGGEDTELQRFFKNAMKRMTGHCLWCSAKTETHVYKYAIFSICHILDKRETVCPSVATNPCNWIELCPDHHTKFDSMNWEEREQLGFWDEVRDKLIMLYPNLDPSEHRHFPQSVLDYMNKKNPF